MNRYNTIKEIQVMGKLLSRSFHGSCVFLWLTCLLTRLKINDSPSSLLQIKLYECIHNAWLAINYAAD